MIGILFGLAALQSASPNYAAEAQDLIRLQTAVSFCDRVGYAPVEGAGEQAESQFDQRLRDAGQSEARITGLKSDARRIEGNRLARAFDLPAGVENSETRRFVRETRAVVNQTCSDAKATFPEAFHDNSDEGRYFAGHVGLWTDHPVIEEMEFFLTSRGACSNYLAPFDADEAATRLAEPFAGEPEVVRTALHAHLVRSYREGIAMGREFDRTQCGRVMLSARQALLRGWATAYSGRIPYPNMD